MLEAYHKLQPEPKTMYCGRSGLPSCRNPIAKGVNDFHKQIKAYVPANGGYFEHEMLSLR